MTKLFAITDQTFFKVICIIILVLGNISLGLAQQSLQMPSSKQIVSPIYKKAFREDEQGNICKERKDGGIKKTVAGYETFTTSDDSDRQIDPQIAVGNNYVLEGTNNGILIYDKQGNFVDGVSQKCFNNGIDPKLFFDIHNRVFVFDMWWYYDKAKLKPVNIAVSATSNPNMAWYIYPISRTEEVDGGGIGYSKKWIGYSYPGGKENTLVLKTADAITGKPATVYFFEGGFGQPAFGQDSTDDLYFFAIDEKYYTITKLTADENDDPVIQKVCTIEHLLKHVEFPPLSPQKDTNIRIASGDNSPKNVVLQNGFIWFSHTVNINNRAAVQWHQINANTGKLIQSGIIKSDTASYIQTTLAVNKKQDVLIGFQQVSPKTFVNACFAIHKHKAKAGRISKIVTYAKGQGPVLGESWGDYSGTIIDGDNLLDMWTIQTVANKRGAGTCVVAKVPFR